MALSLSYTQDSFEGGINLVSLGTKVKANEYITGINVRTRFGYAEPINDVIDLTEDLPVANLSIQGLYAFGEILICFLGGIAYYKDVSISDGIWMRIEGFQMSSSVSRIYTQAVPVSSLLYLRKNTSGQSPNADVIFDPTQTNGASAVSLVVQDGINQPWLIGEDGTARLASTYAEWDKDTNREYIPIGKQMVYSLGILFVVSADGKSIFRSVSGRPLDFVVAIDNNGDKVSDAVVTSFAVDSNEIKLIATLNSDNLIVITAYTAYLVNPDFTDTIYAEPTFSQTFLFTAGTINQFCWADLLGDFAFIDREGLKSFNAIQQLKFEGNNSVFSLGISKLFKNIVQDDNACCGSYDNYTFFSVKTSVASSSILVYDSVKEVFSSIDLLSSKAIKQFATTYSASRQRFFGCSVNKVYELYSPDSTVPLEATIFTREMDSRNADQGVTDGVYNIKTQSVQVIFEEGVIDGEVSIAELVNNAQQSDGFTREILATVGGLEYPVTLPAMFSVDNGLVSIIFPNKKKKEGQKLGYVITWTGGAKLTYFIARCDSDKGPSSIQQQSRVYTSH
jgi:hypothetical protein